MGRCEVNTGWTYPSSNSTLLSRPSNEHIERPCSNTGRNVSKEANPQPDFGKPPVSEVLMSVEFLPLQNWRPPHAGLYWGCIDAEYPKTDVQFPIASERERFGDEYWVNQKLRVELAQPESARYWFIGADPTRLIQVQRDRFIINWRKVADAAPYPRYHKSIRPRFEKEWKQFRGFVSDKTLGAIEVQQCEITYVNDIEQGQGWNTFNDFGALFAPWVGTVKDSFLPPLQSLKLNGSFEMPNQQGRLNFVVHHLRRGLNGKEVIQVQLIARGKPKSTEDADIMAWIDALPDWLAR